ncbi:MAG: hypothetical protein KDI71_04815 [Xanthomonadales bacterium]|nr:hypothetical protein [Xanthomonadales bacterium]
MAKKKWNKFPHPAKAFDYSGSKLAKAWDDLHAGDQEPFPDADEIGEQLAQSAALVKAAGNDAAAIAEQLTEAWRCFHRGDFQQATELGEACFPFGSTVANKASGIYANYLADEGDKEALYKAAADRSERASKLLPDDTNAHYFRAFALGRFSQCISIGKALAQGLGGKIKESLDKALALNDDHAEAHTAMGLYHAEIISKVGAMIGGLTYGAKADKGLAHLNRARELTPEAPIAHIEYANGLLLLYGDKKMDDAVEAYELAAELKPRDAMEKLDVELAKEELSE